MPLLFSALLSSPYRVMMSLCGRSGSWQHGENDEPSAMRLDDLSLAIPVGEEIHHFLPPQRQRYPQGEMNSQPLRPHVSVVDYVCPNGKRSQAVAPSSVINLQVIRCR